VIEKGGVMLNTTQKMAIAVTIVMFTCIDYASAAHIGNVKIQRIRNWSPSYVVVWLDKSIANPPACATVHSKIVVSGMDSEWGKQKLSMLMTAMAAGYSVNPNCTTSCWGSWDGQITVCNEVSIQK
jgi:hypothetical protein